MAGGIWSCPQPSPRGPPLPPALKLIRPTGDFFRDLNQNSRFFFPGGPPVPPLSPWGGLGDALVKKPI